MAILGTLELWAWAAIGGGVLLLTLLVMLAVMLSRSKAQMLAMESRSKALEESQLRLGESVQHLANENVRAQSTLSQSLNQRLDGLQDRMGRGIAESATKTASSIAQVQERLKVIDEAQKKMTEVSDDIISLQDILQNKQRRGVLGEVILEDQVRDILPSSSYSFQTILSNGKKPDCLISFPNQAGAIAIDAKFPLESFLMLNEATSDQERAKAESLFRRDIREHIDAIAKRYLNADETADTAVMFIPSESVFAELHEKFPDLAERARKARVMIVAPATLMGALLTMRAVMKDAQMREQAGVIQKEMSGLIRDVELLDERVEKLDKHFDQAHRDIEDIQKSTRNLTRKARKIEAVDLEDGAAEITVAPKAAELSIEG